MLEDSLKTLKIVDQKLREYLTNQEVDDSNQQKIADDSSKMLHTILQDERNTPDVRFLAAQMNQCVAYDRVLNVSSNFIYSLFGMTVSTMEVALTLISEELFKLKNPSEKAIHPKAEKISELEQNIEALKKDLENMKPTMTRLRKDYVKRKKWLNENR